MSFISLGASRARSRRTLLIVLVISAELCALAFAYQFLATFDCRSNDAGQTCRMLRSLVARAIVMLAAFGLFIWARPQAMSLFHVSAASAGDARPRHPGAGPLLHLAGVALILLPLVTAPGGDLNGRFGQSLLPWLAGSVMASIGALLWLAPLRIWADWLRAERFAPLLVLGFAFFIPDLANGLLPLWNWEVVTALTFDSVVAVLSLVAADIYASPADLVIGTGDFLVLVAQSCSGLEGIALVTGFVVIYAFLFRRDLRFPHYWLVVLPLGLALSWMLNVVRIAALILIGAHISPEIAVNGFHSYAGWMFFTLLALLLIWLVQAMPWLRRDSVAPAQAAMPPLREDWLAGRILPFAAFMLVGTVISALTLHPDIAYPWKAAALTLALFYFRRSYSRIAWVADPVALGAGAVVGVLWLLTEPAPAEGSAVLAEALAGLGGVALAVWIVSRVIGTALLVPMVEELFFRGYLLGRLDFGGIGGKVFAIALSNVLFAALHGRWFAAWAAGVVFALVMLRRGRLGDAVLAHVVANATIAAWALMQGDLMRI